MFQISRSKMAAPSYGSPDRPMVRFFFTATCPQLGLKGPVFRPPVGPEVPSFQENSNRLVCKICGSTVANVVELVEHWKVEVARSGGKAFKVEKTQGLPFAQVENIQVHQNSEQEGAESVLMNNAQKREENSSLIDQIEGQVMYSTLDSVKKECEYEKLLECDKCEYACNRRATLKKHKYSKHILGATLNESFKCDECKFVCDKIELFRAHKKEQHKMQIYKCLDCDFACNLESTIRLHRSSSHKDLTRSMSCNECDYTCLISDTLIAHKLRKHSGVPPVIEPIIQCSDCSYTGIQRHYVLHKKKHDTLSCDDCAFSGNFVELRTHREKVHNEKRYPCNQCDFRGITKGRRDRHVKAKHEKSVHFCDKCGYKTSYSDNLKLHLKTHDPENWFQCEQCPVRTPTRHMLRNHKDKDHHEITESQYSCSSCDFVTSTKSRLYVHSKKHKEQKEPERKKCEACDFSHFNSHYLKRHFIARHTKTRFPFLV